MNAAVERVGRPFASRWAAADDGEQHAVGLAAPGVVVTVRVAQPLEVPEAG